MRDMETTIAPKVWVRHQTVTNAVAAAGRLAAKYGQGSFAVVADADGGDFAPFAVVSHPTTTSAR